MSGTQSGAPMTLSMRERAELDTLYARVFAGEHYKVLGVPPGASAEDIQKSYLRLARWLDVLSHPDRDLGEYRPRVEVVASAVENAFRIVGNPRERLLYDGQHSGPVARAAARSDSVASPRTTDDRESAAVHFDGTSSGRSMASRGWQCANGAVPRVDRMMSAASQLVQLLDAHLGVVLERDVSLQQAAGGAINLDDSVRYARRAEEAEQTGRWADAAVYWHLVLLTAPQDATIVLRAATALRWAGARPRVFERYTRLVSDGDLLGPPAPSVSKSAPSNASAEASEAQPIRSPTRRPVRR